MKIRKSRNAKHADDPSPLDANCRCPACRDYSRAYLHHVVKAHEIIARNREEMKELLLKNIRAEKPKTDPTVLAELISTFFSGLCVEQNLDRKRPSTEREIRALMTALRGS